jgi:hypothetical protein
LICRHLHFTVERKVLLDASHEHHHGAGIGAVRGAHHRLRLDDFGVRRDERRGGVSIQDRQGLGLPRLGVLHPNVSRDERAGLAQDRGSEVLRERAEAYHRPHTNRDAGEEQEKPKPRRARLAPGHVQDEAHVLVADDAAFVE